MRKQEEWVDPRMAMALCRYEIISRYLALKPRRGLKRKVLEKLAQETWNGPNGKPMQVSAETIRVWARRYRRGGLQCLMDKQRQPRSNGALTDEQKGLICALKQEVPARSIDRIIKIAEETGNISPGVLRRSTVHRVLRAKGLSKRRLKTPDKQDLDRFEAECPNDLWQSDMLVGPWLPDPDHPGKVRRANLFLFMDDHSRLILHGRFSFSEDLPHMELVFRRAVQKHGVPSRVYFDNGKVYRAGHIKQMAAELSIYRIIYTRPHRPEGHGKIEALNRYIRGAFIAEVAASNITTLEALNEAFVAWLDKGYNNRVHGETGETPRARWERHIEEIRFADEEKLRQAFLWSESRTADKTGVFKLFGVKYQVGPGYGRTKLQVRYDPEALHEVEVWQGGAFVQRARPLFISAHRRPKQEAPAATDGNPNPVVDYLAHLVQERRAQGVGEPTPKALAKKVKEKREQNIRDIITLLDDRLDHGVVSATDVRTFMDTYGPLDVDLAEIALDEMLQSGAKKDHHVSVYLGVIRDAAKGGMQ